MSVGTTNERADARDESARLASGDRIGRQPLGRRCGLSGQRHRRAGEDVGTSSGLREPPA